MALTAETEQPRRSGASADSRSNWGRSPLPGTDSNPQGSSFPYTCEWCHKAPADHLAIYDYKPPGQSTARMQKLICGPCGHIVNLLPDSIRNWWLFRLAPDNCGED